MCNELIPEFRLQLLSILVHVVLDFGTCCALLIMLCVEATIRCAQGKTWTVQVDTAALPAHATVMHASWSYMTAAASNHASTWCRTSLVLCCTPHDNCLLSSAGFHASSAGTAACSAHPGGVRRWTHPLLCCGNTHSVLHPSAQSSQVVQEPAGLPQLGTAGQHPARQLNIRQQCKQTGLICLYRHDVHQ